MCVRLPYRDECAAARCASMAQSRGGREAKSRAGGHGLAIADSYMGMASVYEELRRRLPAYRTLG